MTAVPRARLVERARPSADRVDPHASPAGVDPIADTSMRVVVALAAIERAQLVGRRPGRHRPLTRGAPWASGSTSRKPRRPAGRRPVGASVVLVAREVDDGCPSRPPNRGAAGQIGDEPLVARLAAGHEGARRPASRSRTRTRAHRAHDASESACGRRRQPCVGRGSGSARSMRFAALIGSHSSSASSPCSPPCCLGGDRLHRRRGDLRRARRCSACTTSSSAATRSCATTRCSGTCGSCWRRSGPSCSSTSSSATTTGARTTATPAPAIYERAKGIQDEQAYGTERDVAEPGYEWLLQSIHSSDPPKEPPRVRVGGPDCTQPYEMALLNVSAMSFGALSAQRAHRAEPRRGARAASPTTPARAACTDYHLQGRRPGLGDRHRLLRRADQGRRLRRRTSSARRPRTTAVKMRLAEAQPGRQAGHRRRAARRPR